MPLANDGSQCLASIISKFIIGQVKQMRMLMHCQGYLGMCLKNRNVKNWIKSLCKQTMMKAEDPCAPLGEQSVISLAAQFFAPDYAPQMSIGEWRREQEKDGVIQKIIQLIQNDALFRYRSTKNDNP